MKIFRKRPRSTTARLYSKEGSLAERTAMNTVEKA